MKKSALSVLLLASVLTTALWSGLASAATNIAQGKTTFASSVKNNSQTPERAVDGDYGTRWSSDHSDNEWITVDLGEHYDLSEVRVNWHDAYAKDYDVQVSDDGNSWTAVKSVFDSDGGLDELSLSGQGRYVRIEGYRPATKRGYALLELEVYGELEVDDTSTSTDDTDTSTDDTDTSTDDTSTSTDDTGTSTENVALHKTAFASSVENDSLGPEQAIDGDPDTRWSSDFSDHNWITVDLGSEHELQEVKLYWQNSYSKDYDIKVSDDGDNWTTVKSVIDSDGGLDEWSFSARGRYVRIEGYRRATDWGHSLWELEVYGYASDTDTTETGDDSTTDSDTDTTDSEETDSVEEDTQAPTVPTGLTAVDVGDTWAAVSWDASSDDTEVFSYELYRDGALVAELLAPTTSYTDEGLASGASYHYAVRAGDSAGNWSGLSESLQVSTTESTETDSTVDDSTTVEGAVTLEWVTPDQRENGDYLELYEIGGYEIRYRNLDSSETKSIIIEDNAATSYSFESLEGDYQFSIAVYDTNGLYSQFTEVLPVE